MARRFFKTMFAAGQNRRQFPVNSMQPFLCMFPECRCFSCVGRTTLALAVYSLLLIPRELPDKNLRIEHLSTKNVIWYHFEKSVRMDKMNTSLSKSCSFCILCTKNWGISKNSLAANGLITSLYIAKDIAFICGELTSYGLSNRVCTKACLAGFGISQHSNQRDKWKVWKHKLLNVYDKNNTDK